MKDFKRKETRYILKHVSGKYFKNTAFATSYDAFLTDEQYDELKAVAIMGMNEKEFDNARDCKD